VVSRWDNGTDGWEHYNIVMHWTLEDSKQTSDSWYWQDFLEKSQTISFLPLGLVLNGTTLD